MLLVRKPGSTALSLERLVSISPAPISSTSAAAISPTTSPLRNLVLIAVPVRPPSRRSWFNSGRADCSAGARPASSPTIVVARLAIAATRQSSVTSDKRVSCSGATASRTSTPQPASIRPAAPPTHARSRLSTMSCRASRHVLAPSDARTASSRRRDRLRASIRPATLAQAIRRTHATAPSRTSSPVRTSTTSDSASGRT